MRDLTKLYLPLLMVVLMTGCGDKKEGAATGDKSPSQVAAKVNGTELTVHQINYALQRIPNLDKAQTKPVSLQVVRNLVDQELLVQKAMQDKMDRDPAVVQALDAARRQILAEAYLGKKLGTTAAPTDAQVADYFNKHPELFSERKIYRLQEISIKAPKDKHDAVRAQLGASKNLQDFGTWLKAQNLPAKAAQGVKPAEQLPLQILPRLAQMSPGQALVVNAPDGLLVVMLAETQKQPVTLEQAKPVISRLLQTQARQQTIQAELGALKTAAKIEYLGEFAEADKKVTAAVTPEPAAPAARPAEADADAINKGLSGLK